MSSYSQNTLYMHIKLSRINEVLKRETESRADLAKMLGVAGHFCSALYRGSLLQGKRETLASSFSEEVNLSSHRSKGPRTTPCIGS